MAGKPPATESSPRGWRRWLWLLPAFVLVAAVALQSRGSVTSAPAAPAAHLAHAIPAEPTGWTSKPLPLGESEFIAGEVEKVLRYDEVFYREYQGINGRFSLYVVYWAPGKMPTQLVASHTPDRCWTENGWRCVDQRYRATSVFSGVDLLPAEWRLFEPPQGGQPTYVLFWHLVNGQPYDYGKRLNAVPDPLRWWRGAVDEALRGRQEQYFIRLTSTQPLETLWSDPGFREVVRGLKDLGLAPASPSPASS